MPKNCLLYTSTHSLTHSLTHSDKHIKPLTKILQSKQKHYCIFHVTINTLGLWHFNFVYYRAASQQPYGLYLSLYISID